MSRLKTELVTSIWGTVSRREMLRILGIGGVGLGLSDIAPTKNEAYAANYQTSSSQGKIKIQLPQPKGLPYREIPAPTSSLEKIQQLNPALFTKPENFARPITRYGMPNITNQLAAFPYSKPGGAVGRDIFQYTNVPDHPRDSCAQAACATLMHLYNLIPDGLTGDAVTERVYATHPPDVQGDNAGTTGNRLAEAVQDYRMKCWSGGGATVEDAVIFDTLKNWVSHGYPCAVLLDLTQVVSIPGSDYWGHWTVVFAYDANSVYLTNWDYNRFRNDWTSFSKAWKLPAQYDQHRYWIVIGWV